ncbi:hypothetical protein BGX29_004537 [Mortierella sp. GBA35]|nr:hypothetical protein BGX29_004537 [Mortierella sp. GBA35]
MSAKEEAKKDPPPEVTEFQKELHGLFDHSRTASASKIEKLTKLAFKAARYYKNIVYCLEKFITRCVPEYKLTGLYVLDAICRTSQSKAKQGSSGGGLFTGTEYVARFEKNIEALFVEFTKVLEDKEKEKVKRVVEIWERSGTFAATTTDNIKKKYFPLLETEISRAAAAAAEQEEAAAVEAAKAAQETPADKAASYISSLAASLAASNSPTTSAASSNSSNPSTPLATSASAAPSYPPSLHYPAGNAYQPSSSLTSTGTTAANPFIGGISDPSSALALQTLLATVSQVKAATAATSVPAPPPVPPGPLVPGHYPAYPGATTMMMPDYGTAAQGSSLPPVLQQLQGMLSNSNQNQAYAPNNNTVVSSSTVAPAVPTTTSTTGASSSAMSFPPGFPGAANVPGGGAPGGGGGPRMDMPRDPRAAPTDPRTQQQQQQQQTQGLAPPSMPMDPRADPRLMQGRPGPMGAQPPNGPAQPMYQAQPPFQGAVPPPLHLGSLLDGQRGMLMRNVPGGGVIGNAGAGGPNKSGAGFDGHAMAQLASFMNGMQEGGSLPHQSSTTVKADESNGGAQPSGPFSFSGPPGSVPGRGHGPHDREDSGGSIHSHGGQSRPGVAGQDGYRRGGNGEHMNGRRGSVEDMGNNQHHHHHHGSGSLGGHKPGYGVKEDPSVAPDQIKVISRTLWVGGSFIPTISEPELEAIFSPLGKIASLIFNQAKFNAFIKMTDRADAERCKAELDRTQVQGEVMKVGWGCGFGPRDLFDYTTGTSLIPVERLTDTDRRWLMNSVVGGFGMGEPIRGGVSLLEPNIEAVGRDGRESLPRRGGLAGSGGHLGGGGRGRGRGRGRGGDMDHDDFGGAVRGRGRGGHHMPMMGSNGPPSRGRGNGGFDGGEQQQQPVQQSPLLVPRTHPLPHRPQPIGAGGVTAKRDFVGGAAHQQQQQPQQQGLPTGQGDDLRRNKKSRWE